MKSLAYSPYPRTSESCSLGECPGNLYFYNKSPKWFLSVISKYHSIVSSMLWGDICFHFPLFLDVYHSEYTFLGIKVCRKNYIQWLGVHEIDTQGERLVLRSHSFKFWCFCWAHLVPQQYMSQTESKVLQIHHLSPWQ